MLASLDLCRQYLFQRPFSFARKEKEKVMHNRFIFSGTIFSDCFQTIDRRDSAMEKEKEKPHSFLSIERENHLFLVSKELKNEHIAGVYFENQSFPYAFL